MNCDKLFCYILLNVIFNIHCLKKSCFTLSITEGPYFFIATLTRKQPRPISYQKKEKSEKIKKKTMSSFRQKFTLAINACSDMLPIESVLIIYQNPE